MEKNLPNKLQFYAVKTPVHSGENCSFVPRKLQFHAEKTFQN